MIPFPSGGRVWIATGHTDMRRGMQGLALQVQESLRRETPMVGSGPNGLATLGDLTNEAAKTFPSAFNGKAGGGRDAPPGARTLTRTEFNSLTPVEQRQKVLIEKCAVVDGPPRPAETRRPPKPAEKVITREAFNKLDPAAQYIKVRTEGFKVVD
jgi:hypothetical protein